MGITENEKKKWNKTTIGIIISFCALIIIYFGVAAYFSNHFYFGSQINGVNVSGKTVEEAKVELTSNLKVYSLSLKERDGKSEEIKGRDISLKNNSGDQIKKFKDKQSPYKWITASSNTENIKMTVGVSYDIKLLKEKVEKLSCVNSKNIVEPKNPSFKYTDKGYVILDEVNGNKVNKDILYDCVVKAINKGETSIDLESNNCYIKPKYTSKSSKVIETKDTLNKYGSSKITYTSGENREVLDGAIINKWLIVNDNLEIVLDEEKVKNYIGLLCDKFNTIGKVREFTTSSGKTVKIGDGDYGWGIDTTKETQDLIAAIKAGKIITKEPTYLQTAAAHGKNDIGSTYVEIDMTNQHLWFYKNGSLVVQGDVVTGNVSGNNSTPQGIYKLKYKERDAVLRGQGYSAPVDFWMPFNAGIGIHDASWRSQFGGNIYRTNGSHGCVNSPYYLAKTLFDNIDEGTPVICYYLMS